jgi:probable HAF family extracellular repeat protein
LLGVSSLEAGLYTVEILGSLGSGAALATGINNSGSAVGWITDSQGNVNLGYSWKSDGVTHGFLYRGGVMLDLNSLLEIGSGWTIDGAYGINDAGQILGQATYNGQHHAVDLNPVLTTPEPAAMALVFLGLLAVASIRRIG